MKETERGMPDTHRAAIGKRIRELRKAKGISQQTLADKMDVDRSAVCKWENGVDKPSDEHMRHLADYFGIPIDYLSDGRSISLERGKAKVQELLLKYGKVKLSSLRENECTGGDQDESENGGGTQ